MYKNYQEKKRPVYISICSILGRKAGFGLQGHGRSPLCHLVVSCSIT